MNNANRGLVKKLCGLAVAASAQLSATVVFAQAAPATASAAGPGAPQQGCGDSANKGFGDRLSASYQRALSWNGDAPDAAPNWREGLQPPPVSGPPFPFTNWPMGGTQNIGYENLYSGPLMDAIWCGPGGQRMKDSRFTVYGWLEPGMNLSTSKSKYNLASGTGGNWPAAYSYQPNTAQIDQIALYFERTPDEVQTAHMDWGFRLALLYGTDYKYTFSKGLLSNQYTNQGKKLGFDPVMAYLDFYFPQVLQGLNLRIGRYISIPDIEAQLAPNNYTYSHSLLYSYDPYTQEGVVGTFKVNKNWTFQLEASVGNDIVFWDRKDRQFTPAACVTWTSDSGGDSIYPCLNGYNPILGNNGKFAWNNLQHAVVTWYHVFDERWHMASEVWAMHQDATPNVNNPTGLANLQAAYPLKFGAPFGAQCSDPSAVSCTSHAHAFVNYINYKIGPRDFITWRNEMFYDAEGQRTGFKTRYFESLLGWNHWIGNAITIRPELRFERSLDVDAYDNPSGLPGGGKKNQTTFAVDAIFHF